MKILFITLSNIGDCILTLPVLDCLRLNFPEAQITVVVGPRPALIFQNNRSANKVFVYDKHAGLPAKFKLVRALRESNFDLIVDLRNSIFSWLVPARRKNSRLLRFSRSHKHMASRHLFKLSGLGLKIERFRAEYGSLSVSRQDEEHIRRLLNSAGIIDKGRLIIISPGARSLIKRWPKEKFVALINDLPQEYKAVLIGDQDDVEISRQITQEVKVPVLDLTGKTTLLQAAALLKKAELLITNDSANLHLASYLNVPVVAVFGPTDDVKYGPWPDKWKIAKKEIFCRPCMKAVCRFGTLECLQRVGMEQVLMMVKEMLGVPDDSQAGTRPAPKAKSVSGGQAGSLQKEYKRILIVRTDRVGDVILSTPVIKALRSAYPNAYLAMVVRPYTRIIVDGNPNLDEVILYDKDSKEKNWFAAFKFSRELAKKKFDLAVVLNPSNRSNLIPFLAGIPRRIGYDRKYGFLLTDRIKDTKHAGKKHEIEYNLDIVRALGVEAADNSSFVPVSPESEKWAEDVLKKENILPFDKLAVINPGASEKSKMWFPERYAGVANKLAEKGVKIIILGGPGDKEIAGQVINNLRCAYINMVGNNNISQAASLLKRCALFISSDTGPMHLASCVGTPVIAILGRSQPGLSPLRWGPRSKKSVVIHKELGCEACLAHNCKKGFLCLQAITENDVLAAAEKILNL